VPVSNHGGRGCTRYNRNLAGVVILSYTVWWISSFLYIHFLAVIRNQEEQKNMQPIRSKEKVKKTDSDWSERIGKQYSKWKLEDESDNFLRQGQLASAWLIRTLKA
jgi:hypothetical protein